MSDNQAADYEKDASSQHARWVVEFAAARKALEGWQSKGEEIDKEFRNEQANNSDSDTRLPLFTSDIQTVMSMLYGQVPRSVVSRRYGDADDNLARVGGEILERLLNADIGRPADSYAVALGCVLMDYFLPGFGQARCRYVTGEIESTDVPEEKDEAGNVLVEGYTDEKRPDEDVCIDYIHWSDWLWGPAKVAHLVPWWTHRSQMTRAQLIERFGAIGKMVPLAKRKDGSDDPWSRADVWEIYEKDTCKVYWFCEAYDQLLDMKDDPLGLENFYPFPSEPLIANLTTSKVVPRPYYALHQDQYRQINMLMSRIRELVDAVRVSGCYDASSEHIPMMLKPEGRGRLIPVQNWLMNSDKGGIRGSVDFFPVEMVVQAISVLQGQLMAEIDLLHQTTGYSDIMRGEATQAGATATEQRVKTRFGSVRIQRMQDEIARYATDLLKIKGEIVVKHFATETILARANVRFMPKEDQDLAVQAVELLKSDFACYRIEVKPEAVALSDFASMKQERGELLATLTTYFQAMQPIAQQMPGAIPHLLKIAQWTVAGVRGSSEIEGVFDLMVQQAEQAAAQAAANPQQPPQDPKLQAEQVKLQGVQFKAQADMQKEQFKAQAAMQQSQAEVQNDAMREENQRIQNVQEAGQKAQIEAAFHPPPVHGGFP